MTTHRCSTLLGLLLLAGAGCGRAAEATGSPASGGRITRVRTVKPCRQDIVRRVLLPANVRAEAEVTLYAKATGFLKSIGKDRGDKVKAGELIALLEIPEMTAEIAHARASFALEEATLKRLESIRKIEKTAVTDQDLDLARAKKAMAEATLQRLETLHAYTEIRAPFDGAVTERFVDPGAFIQQGRIVSIVDISKVRIIVDVPEAEVRFSPVGTEARVSLDALPGKAVVGKISRSSESLDPVMRTMRIEIDLPNPNLSIYPGMYARVELGVERHPNVLAIPRKVVTLQHDHTFVFVNAGGTAKKVPVTVGTDDGDWCEARSGLNGDESIIIPEGGTMTDGMAVLPAEGT
ncbi:MAG: efflux RND transporter periplasmic adaptor subunit [Planctomycetes bacterium]|nr:efflux RND transporter periplasmic adaptor subunit [Planctomycetota bacterium]